MKLGLNKKKGAFTLIELLVVIAIIGILSGLIVVSMNGATNSANDAKRKANLDAIRKALIVYGTLNRMIYPIQPTLCTIGGGTTPCSTLASNLSELLPNLPTDPVAGNYYTYVSDATGSNYVLSGVLSSSTLSYSNNGGYASGPVDIDGNSYGAVTIGTQTWMTSNLMTTKYNDGTAIIHGDTNAIWTSGTNNDHYSHPPAVGNGGEADLNADIIPNKLGFLYQQGVVNSGKLCPTGWRVPSDLDWKTLIEYLGTAGCETSTGWQCSPAGASLKESGTTHWSAGNTGTNASGFSAVGTGYRGTGGSFYNRSVGTYLWSSSSTLYRALYYTESTVYRYTLSAAYGFSVRCLKD